MEGARGAEMIATSIGLGVGGRGRCSESGVKTNVAQALMPCSNRRSVGCPMSVPHQLLLE